MNRRLRKKKRVGEFEELGFEVLASLRPTLVDTDLDAFLDRWIAAVEARKLAFGGGGTDGKFEGFVTCMGRGSATEEDRQALAAFLEQDVAIVSHAIRALRDAWCDWKAPGA